MAPQSQKRGLIKCVKTGTKYGPEYVNILQNMVSRYLTIPHDFYCITDDPEGVNCPTFATELDGWWAKLQIFQKRPFWLKGKILYLDLDIVIRENINCFIQDKDFIIIKDWNLPMYNSSVFLLNSGARHEVWEKFIEDPGKVKRETQCGDQHWITLNAKASYWPSDWCTSYRQSCEGKIVVFHGLPKPHEVSDGWVKLLWR